VTVTFFWEQVIHLKSRANYFSPDGDGVDDVLYMDLKPPGGIYSGKMTNPKIMLAHGRLNKKLKGAVPC
jgi:hypothetical protein